MNLYVTRHGQTKMNVENLICGITESDLTEEGLKQAAELARKASELDIDVIITSSLKRAQLTSKIVAEVIQVPIITDDRIKEQNYGDYENTDRFGEDFIKNKGMFAWHFPNGESMMTTAQRVYNFLDDCKQTYAHKNVLLVCHGGICRIIRSYFMNMTNEEFVNFRMGNCEIMPYEL